MSNLMKISVTGQSQSLPCDETQNLLYSDKQLSSNQTNDSSEQITELNQRFETSLYVSNKPESNSHKVESYDKKDQSNISPAVDVRESELKIYRRQSVKKVLFKPNESIPGKDNIVNCIKTDDNKSSSLSTKTADPNFKAVIQKQPHAGRGSVCSKSSYSQNSQHFPTRHYSKAKPILFQQNSNPFIGPEQRFTDPNFTYIPKTGEILYPTISQALKQNRKDKYQRSFPVHSNQWQFQHPNGNTKARPVLLSSNMRTSYCNRLPVRMNAVPSRYVSSQSYYSNSTPNAVPTGLFTMSPHYRNQKPTLGKNKATNQLTQTKTLHYSREFPPALVKNRFPLTSQKQDLSYESPVMEKEKYIHQESKNPNTMDLNLEPSNFGKTLTQIKEPTKAEELMKTKELIKEEEQPKTVNSTTATPFIETNDVASRFVSSQSNYSNPTPNAVPMQLFTMSPHYRNQKPSLGENRASTQVNQTKTPHCSEDFDFPMDVIKNSFHSTPEKQDTVYESSVMEQKKYEHQESEKPNTMDLNLEQSNFLNPGKILTRTEEPKKAEEITETKEELRQTENPTTTTNYRKKNNFNNHVPNNRQATSFLTSYLQFQGRIDQSQLHEMQNPFPTPSSSTNYVYTSKVEGRIIPNHLYQHLRTKAQLTSNDHLNIYPLVPTQPASLPNVQDNTLIQSGSSAYSSIQQPTEETIFKPNRVQYQPTMQNSTPYTHNQCLNRPLYQYGTQCQPTMQNLPAVPKYNVSPPMNQYQLALKNINSTQQYQNPYQAIYHYGTQLQPTMQNQTIPPQYQDPNTHVYQYGTEFQLPLQGANLPREQYQPLMPNITAASQYEYPNLTMCQYGEQMSPESFGPVDTSWYSPIHNGSIPTLQEYPNIPMHTHAANPFMVQDATYPYVSAGTSYPFTCDPNLV